MANMVAIVKKMIQENPQIHIKEVARRLKIDVERAAIYIMWVYAEGDPNATQKK